MQDVHPMDGKGIDAEKGEKSGDEGQKSEGKRGQSGYERNDGMTRFTGGIGSSGLPVPASPLGRCSARG